MEPPGGKEDLSSPVQGTWPLPASDVGFFIPCWSVADFQCFSSFQVDSKLIQVYTYTYLFFFRFFSSMGRYRVLRRIPCAVPEALVYLFYIQSCVYAGKAMAARSSPLAWKIPWTEEPGRLQSMGSL